MQVVRFECPHCSASLKVRESDLVAKPVDCPECHKPIVVRVDQKGNVAAQKPDEPSAKTKKPANVAAAPADGRRTPAEEIYRAMGSCATEYGRRHQYLGSFTDSTIFFTI